MPRHKHAKEIIAWAEGKEIQCRHRSQPGFAWKDIPHNTPDFHSDCWEWRVKPEKKKGWIAIHSRILMNGGRDCGTIWNTKELCEANNVPCLDNKRVAIVEIEWEEE